MRKFGIKISGNEEIIENIFKEYFLNFNDNDFKYLEIGVAGGITLRAIYDIIKENIKITNWQVIGLDLCNGYSLNFKEINSVFSSNEIEVYNNGENGSNVFGYTKNARLVLDNVPRSWISTLGDNSLDIVFIDGCHGYNCVTADFLNIEPKVKNGGIVFFHDCGLLEQGADWQDHCKEFINVRKAISDLGLFDNKYPGWTMILENPSPRLFGIDGNGTVFFKKNG